MHPATINVSRALPDIATALRIWLAELAKEHVGFLLIVFTPERLSYWIETNQPDKDVECARQMGIFVGHCETPIEVSPELQAIVDAKPGHAEVGFHMNTLARFIDQTIDIVAPRQTWCFLVFTDGVPAYASNADREDVVPILREMREDILAGKSDGPAHNMALH